LPEKPLKSYWLTSLVGSTGAFLLCGGNSLLAPPAIFLLDGPGLSPPPIAVTLLSSYYDVSLAADTKPPQVSIVTKLSDIFVSFIVLPFAVVWFWRGSWLVLDNYLYGFTPDDEDVNMSLLWCAIVSTIIFALTSEPVVGLVGQMIKRQFLHSLLGRFRTYLLAWGKLNFREIVITSRPSSIRSIN
jgi:Fuseless